MEVVFGGRALAAFRLERLARALGEELPKVALTGACHVYFLERGLPSDPEMRARLQTLLDEGTGPAPAAPPRVFVIPRFGTISPWSSKATDILERCGFGTLGRIERGIGYCITGVLPQRGGGDWSELERHLADRLTQRLVASLEEAHALFKHHAAAAERMIPLIEEGERALTEANVRLGLALGEPERAYLLEAYAALGRDPTETELMMFAQVNSEHCRHKIFRANWTLDGEPQSASPFEHIRESYRASPGGILSAYKDNAAVLAGPRGEALRRDPVSGRYLCVPQELDIAIKVETHNHPTAVAPFPGAATGSGGEIRDEAATGRGGSSKAGLTGYAVSDLCFEDAPRAWEHGPGTAPGLASSLQVMLEGPIGAASFNNEFGRPAIAGFFRSFCRRNAAEPRGRFRGYHKPVMLAGGLGTVRRELVEKRRFGPGTKIVVLGGPAMEIGLGGGAASSRSGGEDAQLDFASVQRGNPEMQRRAQEVIDAAVALGDGSPILAIHDVGAGGLSNAVPELLADAGVGGHIELANVPSAEPGMSPMALWCNESQERYVLALAPEDEVAFSKICSRECCPWAVIGEATAEQRLRVTDGRTDATVVDLPMDVLLGDLPPLAMRGTSREKGPPPQQAPVTGVEFVEALNRVLALPGVGDKSFLITIGDRTVGGLVARDPLVGPWQVAVGDVAVTAADFRGQAGEAMALGERMPIAVTDAAASARMAVGEAVTNIVAADVAGLGDIRLSANWMAAAGEDLDNGDLYAAVRAVGSELCPALGIAIPVGKDSLSMRVAWSEGDHEVEVRAPLSLAVTAFAPVGDVGVTLTPDLECTENTELWVADLGCGCNRLGGSAFAQVFERDGDPVPDIEDAGLVQAFFGAIRALADDGLVLAYHDRSDGGLAITLIEMALAGHAGLEVDLQELGTDPLAALFAEELGAVIQVRAADRGRVQRVFAARGLSGCVHRVGAVHPDGRVVVKHAGHVLLDAPWADLMRAWAEVGWRIRRLRDDPECADEEYASQYEAATPGLGATQLTFQPAIRPSAPAMRTRPPRVAILREQGINGYVELAAAFVRAGFDAIDVHMSQLLSGERTLDEFTGLAAPGGFSYGDVLGAGRGWAQSILLHPRLAEQFASFLARTDRFALGICNGCQMLAELKELIPGAGHWPRFRRNRSEQFEARLAMVEVMESVSPFFTGMEGSVLPVAVAHGEGRAEFSEDSDLDFLRAARQLTLRYAQGTGVPAIKYPANPNGSPQGATGFANADGRVLVLMPHPERVFRTVQYSWHPPDWGEDAPWIRLFDNIRAWVA